MTVKHRQNFRLTREQTIKKIIQLERVFGKLDLPKATRRDVNRMLKEDQQRKMFNEEMS